MDALEKQKRMTITRWLKETPFDPQSTIFGLVLFPNRDCIKFGYITATSYNVGSNLTLRFKDRPSLIRAQGLEGFLIHTITRTQFTPETKCIEYQGYTINLNEISPALIQKFIDVIFECEDPRINYSWAEYFQDEIIKNYVGTSKKAKRKSKPFYDAFGLAEDPVPTVFDPVRLRRSLPRKPGNGSMGAIVPSVKPTRRVLSIKYTADLGEPIPRYFMNTTFSDGDSEVREVSRGMYLVGTTQKEEGF